MLQTRTCPRADCDEEVYANDSTVDELYEQSRQRAHQEMLKSAERISNFQQLPHRVGFFTCYLRRCNVTRLSHAQMAHVGASCAVSMAMQVLGMANDQCNTYKLSHITV